MKKDGRLRAAYNVSGLIRVTIGAPVPLSVRDLEIAVVLRSLTPRV